MILTERIAMGTASTGQRQPLPGIGSVLARGIIDGRPFKTIEDIMKVKGIKEGEFGRIKDPITVN